MNQPDPRALALAERLRLAREHAGLSQGQVAKMLGLHRPSVSEMEAGRRKVSTEELVEMANIYGVSTAWLLDDESELSSMERSRVELAARELGKLKSEDLELVLQLLSTLRKQGGHNE